MYLRWPGIPITSKDGTSNKLQNYYTCNLACTSLGGAVSIDTLSSSTSITFDSMMLVMFNSVGRRDMPLVSVATTNWVMSAALRSKISAVDLFPENMSSACKIGLLQHEYQWFELNNVYTKVIIHAHQLVYNKWMLVSTMFQWPLHIYIYTWLFRSYLRKK